MGAATFIKYLTIKNLKFQLYVCTAIIRSDFNDIFVEIYTTTIPGWYKHKIDCFCT